VERAGRNKHLRRKYRSIEKCFKILRYGKPVLATALAIKH
jgi:hypothetical protein